MSLGDCPGKKSKRISISFDLNRFSNILDSVAGDPENGLLKTSGENEFEIKKM